MQHGLFDEKASRLVDGMVEVHLKLEPDVRDVLWESNCGSEIFTIPANGNQPMRIGHFQGDADLAAFCVAAHNLMVSQNINEVVQK